MIRRSNSLRRSFFGWGVFAFLYAPLAMVVLQSFNASRHGVGWHGATGEWYRRLSDNEQIRDAAWNTLRLAVLSTVLSTGLGTSFALGWNRVRGRWGRVLTGLVQAPVYAPDIVMAAGFDVWFEWLRRWVPSLEGGLLTMVCAHVTVQTPFVAMVVRARLDGADPHLAEAARDLGADTWQVFRHVTWPLMLPGVVAGALLAFTLSLDDFILSFFTSGPGSTTLPMFIYASVKRGLTPEIHSLSTLMVLASGLAVWLLARRRSISDL